MKTYIKYLLSALLLPALCACDKEGATDCAYTIIPYLQTAQSGSTEPAEEVIAYAFYADTTGWTVKDYADAEAGVLTSRTGAGTKSYDMKARQNEEKHIPLGNITAQPVFILVCDTRERLYGWQQAEVPPGLQRLEVSITFQSWQPVSSYRQGNWTMVVEFAPADGEEQAGG